MKKIYLFLLVLSLGLPAFAQPCMPSYYATGVAAGSMNEFDLTGALGSNILDVLPSSALATGYADRTSSVSAVVLQQGRSYTGAVLYSSASAYTGNQVWIDFNNDSVFADSEFVTAVFPAPANFTVSGFNIPFTLNVPLNAATGSHLMRVRNVSYYLSYTTGYPSGLLNSCSNADGSNHYYGGVTADYVANIVSIPACSGLLSTGNVTGAPTVCPGRPVDLQLINDSVAAGIAFQWFSRPAGAGSYTVISGATSRSYQGAAATIATDYQVKLTCAFSSAHDTSVSMTVSPNPFYQCYCSNSSGGDAVSTTLDSVAIEGTSLSVYLPSNISPYTALADTGFATTSLMVGATYNIFIKSGGAMPFAAAMWIDYNGDGVLDTGEYKLVNAHALAGGIAYCPITIPIIADTGLTGMRIRIITDSVTIANNEACRFEISGQTEDLIVRIVPSTHCIGAPHAGSAFSSVTSACTSSPFYLSAARYTPFSDLTFQWYKKPTSSSSFNAIPGATQALYTSSGQAVATDYELVVTCPSSGSSDTTTPLTIGESAYYQCYCAPPTGVTLNVDATRAPIDSVAITGTMFNNYTPGAFAVYTSYYPTFVSTTANLRQGSHYIMNVNSNGTDYYNAGMWIDYDHSGTYDASEFVNISSNRAPGNRGSVTFTIPTTSDTGLTGMRIRVSSYSSIMAASDGCTDEFGGATADYYIHIDTGIACSGHSITGASSASVSSVCPGQSFLLNNIGAANALGITYQWVSKPSGSGAYTAISGAFGTSYTVPTQSAATNYALVVTCAYSGFADTSSIATVNENPFFTCYCAPATGTTLNDSSYVTPIDSFSIATTTLNNSTPGSTDVYHQYYPTTFSTTALLKRSSTYVMAVNSAGTGNYKAEAWIDYDHSGSFDNSEFILINGTAATPGTPSFISFTVPAGADTGLTGLRVRTLSDIYAATSSDDCNDLPYGATQDYIVHIIPAVPCTGTPTGGTAIAYATTVCPGEAFNLGASGFTSASGITYQWISSPTGSTTYTAITGATAPYSTISTQTVSSDYRLVVTCAGSGLRDTSALVTVNNKPFYICYCAPLTGVTLNTSATAAPIDSVAVVSTNINNPTPGSTAVYRQFYPVTATTSDSMRQGFTYTIAVKSHGTGNYNADAWVDFDQSGTFEPTEFVTLALNRTSGTTSTASLYIPVTADTGLTGMRIRTSESSALMTGTDACTPETNGATEDYVVRIAPGIPCSGTPAAGTAFSTMSAVCAGTAFMLSDTGFGVAVGVTYQWYSMPAGSGTFTAISGATNSTLSISSQTVTTDYRYTVSCSASGSSSNSNIVTVTETPYYSCYCGSSLGTSETSTQIDNVRIPASTLHVAGTYTGAHKVFGMAGDSTGTIQRSLPYTIDLHVTGGSNFNAGMWIDYDHSGTYEASEYVRLDTNTASGTSSTVTFTIPATADTGVTGMRIRATRATNSFAGIDACTNFYYSQTFDFTIKVDTLVRCSGAPDAGTVSSSSPFACPSMTFNLSNTAYAVGSGIAYQWIKRTTGAYSSISGATGHATTISGQTVSTDYALVAHCSFSGGNDTSNILSIIENPFDSCYCSTPTGVSLVNNGGDTDILITSIVGTTMYCPVQTPDTNGYVSVPPTPSYNTATMQRLSTYPITVYVNNSVHTISDAGLWIDYNHNSVFDASEYVHLTQSSDHSNWYGNIVIPTTSSLGLTGMRIETTESGTISSSGSCAAITAGQVQDHIITIVRPPCYSISAISVTAITDSSARGVWGALAGAAGYEWVIDNTPSAPSGSGTVTTDTFANSGCLVSGTTYYLHVRDSCDAGYFSSWTTTSFTTNTCDSVTGLHATGVTNHGATISWSAMSGSIGYEYIVDTSAGIPSGSGTLLSGTSVNVTSLAQGTVYYAHVRSGCHCSNHSLWQTISFTTICDTITHLSVFGITDTSANIKWDSIIGFSNYAYVINTTPGSPSGGGTVIVDTTIRVGGLAPGTTYYAHVSHDCSGGYSYWSTIAFTTGYCDTVTGLTGTSTDTSVRFSFTPVSGSIGYFYVVNLTPGAPSATGTFTTSTIDSVGGLLSATVYYVHVRNNCSGGSSNWTTIAVTTQTCDTITGLTLSNICDTSVTISWTAAASGPGYLFVVNTTPYVVGTPGSYTFSNSVSYTSLAPGTAYYAHIRHLCSFVDSSAWVTVPFTTQACDTVTGLTASGISSMGATISWTGSACVGGYNIVINTFAGAPGGGGTFVTAPTYNATGLLPATNYYAHVQVYCGGGVYSSWVTIPFTTTLCDPATALTISGILDNSVTLNWPAVTGAIGYEYAVDVSATPPASGTFSTGPTQVVSSLNQVTCYYAHVRTQCNVGVYSSWITTPFCTTNVGIKTVNGDAFGVQAYPNPATEKLLVMVTGAAENGVVMITDLTGKVLLRKEMITDKAELNLTQLAAGIYLVKYTDDVHTQTMKLNKQ